jgi:asparagine synthase (glutamine-hydrolysing)
MKDDGALQARVRDVLLDERTRQRGWVNPEFITRLVDLHLAGGWDHSVAIWQLLVLELWMRRYMDGD